MTKRNTKPRLNLIGNKYGKLTVLKLLGRKEESNYKNRPPFIWKCVCDCNNQKIATTNQLRSGDLKSCGCLYKTINITHNMSNTIEYKSWSEMKNRCNNKNSHNYERYGKRGIKVCNRWLNSFENFLEDMGSRPNNTSLDRINNNQGYYPKNCKWSSPKEQSRNRRSNRIFEFEGKKLSLIEITEKLNLNYKTVHNRLTNGMSFKEAISKPKMKNQFC